MENRATTPAATSTTSPTESTAASRTEQTERRARRRPATLLSKLGETLASLFTLAVAGGLWYLGAQYTALRHQEKVRAQAGMNYSTPA